MSFKAKTILLLILLSLVPYVVTMTFLGNAYRNDVESRLMEDMEYQLGVTIDRLDQSLQSLQNDIEFIASLDIMNDVLTGDLDRRIVNLLLLKKDDLALDGDFDVVDTSGQVVASTALDSIGSPFDGESFMEVPLFSTFNNDNIGTLRVRYEMSNLTRYFANDDNFRYALLVNGERYPSQMQSADALSVSGVVGMRPEIGILFEQNRDFAFAVLDRFTRNFLIALVIGTLIISAIAFLAASYILRPILLLSSTARSIYKTHDYSQRVTVDRSDEIGNLASAFNAMIQGMQDLIARLKEEGENRLKLAQEKNRAEMLQTLSNKLSKYLSPQIYESIFSGEKDVKLGSSRKKLTIFFSDIVNFTGTTDQMESEDLTALLNQYLREMTDIALRYGATVDKYIGDAIMIFFGDPHSRGVEEDALLCVEMSLAMQRRVRELHREWRAAGYTKPFVIRVGIHTGYCTVGNFGTESRMDYTIVGSAVNLASRIENMAEPGTVYISEDTYLLVREKFASLPVGKVTPKGISQPVQLYKVLMDEAVDGVQTLSQEGFQLQYQPELLTAESREQLRQVLEKITRDSSS